MAINNPSMSSAASKRWNDGQKQLNAVNAKVGVSDHTIGDTKPVSAVGKTKLPKMGDVDLEAEARKAYKTMFSIRILNNRDEERGLYAKSDFTSLSKDVFHDKYMKLKQEVERIRQTYTLMNQLSAEQIMKLRMIQWAEYLNNHYPAQQRLADRQAGYESKMRGSARTDEDILRNTRRNSDRTITTPDGHSARAVNSKLVPPNYTGEVYDKRAYDNARSQVYDSMDHDNPWRTTISKENRLGNKISKLFSNGKTGGKNSFTREEASAKKHLKEARRILVNNNVANKDKKFKSTGPMDKYTTNEIIKYATGEKNDPYGSGNQFTDKEIAYIKDVISKMKDDYTWEFTVEDAYMDGELFSECESSLVNVESDELVEESAIEELQQLADLL